MSADILNYVAYIIALIINIFAETDSQYMMALLKNSPHHEPLPMSLDFDDKVEIPYFILFLWWKTAPKSNFCFSRNILATECFNFGLKRFYEDIL